MGNAARLGLKPRTMMYPKGYIRGRNGECSPTGIETQCSSTKRKDTCSVEMGNAARLGLKH